MIGAWLVPLVGLLAQAWAASPEQLRQVADCLDLQDIGCAAEVVEQAGLASSSEPLALGMAARAAFHGGDYPEAVRRLEAAVAAGLDDPHGELRLYRNTLHATAGWVTSPQGRFQVRYRPGVDALLVEDVGDILTQTDEQVVPLLGDIPPGSTIVELFPDGERFLAASSLTRADVESTGVVALSKWSRLLVISPRAMGGGYNWQDTVSHEYLHLVIAHNSRDKAPVWLQEGLAKALDTSWRGAPFRLSPKAETQLARAVESDTLVPFREMHPSLAKIKVFRPDGSIDRRASAARAQLAYAQLATLIVFVMEERDEGVIRRVLRRVGEGEDSFAALADEAGRRNFDALIDDWRRWLKRRNLEDRGVESAPLVMGGGSEADADPVMRWRRDLWNQLRLGDLLRERERYRAALVKYDQAADKEDPNSPARAVRMAAAWIGLDDDARAQEILQASVADYPEHAETHRLLARLAEARGAREEAVAHLETAVALAPFRMEDQQRLRQLYAELARTRDVARAERRLEILRLGGELSPPPVLHDVDGPLDIPDGDRDADTAPEGAPRGLAGRLAPDFRLPDLDGGVHKLSALRGRVVVLDFWATWCGPCRAVMPPLSALAERHPPEDLVVLGLSDETEGVIRRFVASEAKVGRTYAYPFLLDDGTARRAYQVSSIPTLVLIDRKGRIHEVHEGAGDMEALARTVGALVAEGIEDPPGTDAPQELR